MSEVSLDRLLILFSAGLGLMVLGGLNFLLNGVSRRVRMSLGGCAAFACTLAPLAIASPYVSAISFSVVLLGFGFLTAVSSATATKLFQSAMTIARRPSVHAAILVASGVTLMVGSLSHFSFDEDSSIEDDMAWMTEVCTRPPTHISTEDAAETDLGTSIPLKRTNEVRTQGVVDKLEKDVLSKSAFTERLIRSQPASDICNCHGWVFTGGRYWLSPEDVEQVLKDNGYQLVSDPRPGDVVIYRQGTTITHTAIIHSNPQTSTQLVEGKWGWMGVFIHRLEDTPYGTVRDFYRSARPGHVLRGLEGRRSE